MSIDIGKNSIKSFSKVNLPLYIMLCPGIVLIFIFSYIPMYGIIIAFQDYNPISGFIKSPFVGLKWFEMVASMPDFKNIIVNTIVIACLKIFFGQLAPLLFALLLNEVRRFSFKRIIQTIVYLPHFLSWVILGGIFIDILAQDGIVNNFLNLFGIPNIFFLGDNHWFRFTLVATDVWKGFGWGAILYLAAFSGINPELYESAFIDGANRWRQMWHVTLPGISSTIIMLGALSLGGILNAGFDQILVLYNPSVYQTGDVIDTFVYRQGLLDMQFSMATAVGVFRSGIGFFLILISNKLAQKYANYRIF